MALRFRRSVGLGGGVRLNVGKTGVGASAGARGARYSVHSSGRRTTSVGVPGTGVGYTTSRGGGRARTASAPPTPATKPGMFAPGYEKAFHKGLTAFLAGRNDAALTHFKEASAKDTGDKIAADDLFSGLLSAMAGDNAGAIPYWSGSCQARSPSPTK